MSCLPFEKKGILTEYEYVLLATTLGITGYLLLPVSTWASLDTYFYLYPPGHHWILTSTCIHLSITGYLLLPVSTWASLDTYFYLYPPVLGITGYLLLPVSTWASLDTYFYLYAPGHHWILTSTCIHLGITGYLLLPVSTWASLDTYFYLSHACININSPS